MIGTDVADRIKRQFGDESGVQVTDADILRWINDAQREFTRTNNLLQARGSLNVVAAQSEYPFPNDVLNLRSLNYDGYKLQGFTLIEFEEYLQANDPRGSATGTPTCYTVWNDILRLYPTPDTSITDGLTILYIARPPVLTVLSDPLALPDEYFNRVVEYCLQQSYELDEDWAAAANKAAQLTSGLMQLQESQTWDKRDTYPVITILDEDL